MDDAPRDTMETVRRLMMAYTKMDGVYYRFARRSGVRGNMLDLLYALGDGQPHTQKQVCEEWQVPKTTLNTNVQELVRGGYLELLPCADRREKLMRLTPAGLAYSGNILPRLYAAERAAFEATREKYGDSFVEAFLYFSAALCAETEGIPVSGPDAAQKPDQPKDQPNE